MMIRFWLCICLMVLHCSIGFGQEPIEIDEARVASNGIRKLEGKHLDLYTDIPSSEQIDELVEVYDQAVPQWCKNFGVDYKRLARWKISGFLIQDAKKFDSAGLIPSYVPPFLNGYQASTHFWFFQQNEDYFRRHLLLHEGTHAFMNIVLRGSGAPWYMEGVAELMACHRWEEKKLQLAYRIKERDEAPDWGRVKILRDAHKGQSALTLNQVLFVKNQAFLKTDAYGWAWGVNAFFDGHPRFQKKYRELRSTVEQRNTTKFTKDFIDKIGKVDWKVAENEWKLFVSEAEYGYDFEKAAIDYKPANFIKLEEKPKRNFTSKFVADRGWQTSGVIVRAGESYLIRAVGEYTVVDDGKEKWICEPTGVTLKYYKEMPLGALTCAIIPSDSNQIDPDDPSIFSPRLVGTRLEISPKTTGLVYFRVNESAARLDDNSGTFQVNVAHLRE